MENFNALVHINIILNLLDVKAVYLSNMSVTYATSFLLSLYPFLTE